MSDLSGIIALAERAARFELLVEIYERETSALLEEIKMTEKEEAKQDAINSIGKSIVELEEMVSTLVELREAVKNEHLGEIKSTWSDVLDHVSSAYGEHLRFDVPNIWNFTEELRFEAEAAEEAAAV
jgi:hypothetical protein